MFSCRRLSGETFGNGVSYRVAACRKRVRGSRTTPRAQTRIHMAEPPVETKFLSPLREDGYRAASSAGIAAQADARPGHRLKDATGEKQKAESR